VSETVLRLRATSDALLRGLEALGALEDEKRGLAPSDPRLTDLARRIHEIAQRVLQRTADQQALTERVATGPTAAVDPPIEAVVRSPAANLDPTTPEATELRILADRLREEYRAAFEARQEE
jgi:uncharacterized membrane protein